eukprot:TRINITY_DN64953_c0_g1_i1.p2 TRINITY_DN64953_c0_g1~~TRINITY_DN64953_c0_g1_i1.p2  ORF type:complete len:120 (-),score=23.91 TRINITY_DN64953_c0_g1_i1:10-369(-)
MIRQMPVQHFDRSGIGQCDDEHGMALSSGLQNALGRRDRIRLARVDLHRLPQRAGQALERAFDDMVIVAAIKQLDMQRDARRLREAVEEMLHHLRVPFAEIGRAVQQECRDRSRMPSSA